MTDNEILWAFTNGCDLLNRNDIDNSELNSIKRCIEKCAEDMLPYVHKYVTHKVCDKCAEYNYKKHQYDGCDFRRECRETIDRPHFKEKKK